MFSRGEERPPPPPPGEGETPMGGYVDEFAGRGFATQQPGLTQQHQRQTQVIIGGSGPSLGFQPAPAPGTTRCLQSPQQGPDSRRQVFHHRNQLPEQSAQFQAIQPRPEESAQFQGIQPPPQQQQEEEQEATAASGLAKSALQSLGKSFWRAGDRVIHPFAGNGDDENWGEEEGGGSPPFLAVERPPHDASAKKGGIGGAGAFLGRISVSGGGSECGWGEAALAELHRAHRGLILTEGGGDGVPTADGSPGTDDGIASFAGGQPRGSRSLAKYPSVKLRAWRTGYSRVLSLHPQKFVTLDPDTLKVTNSWTYSALRQWMALPREEGCILMEVTGDDVCGEETLGNRSGRVPSHHTGVGIGIVTGGEALTEGTGTKLKFRCPSRSDLLCHILGLKYRDDVRSYAERALGPPHFGSVDVGTVPGRTGKGLAGLGSTAGGGLFPLFPDCARQTRRGDRVPCALLVAPHGVVEFRRIGPGPGVPPAEEVRTYPYTDMMGVSLTSDDSAGMMLHLRQGGMRAGGNPVQLKSRLFFVSSAYQSVGKGGGDCGRSYLISALREYCAIIGVRLEFGKSVSVRSWVRARQEMGGVASAGEAIGAGFRVVKKTMRRPGEAVERELVITRGGFLIERDRGSGGGLVDGSPDGGVVSCHSLSDVRCLVRRRSGVGGAAFDEEGAPVPALDDTSLTVEYLSGASRSYSSSVRDSLIVSLLDAASSLSGNSDVCVTDVGTAGYRLVREGAGPDSGPALYSQLLRRVHRISAAAAAYLDHSDTSLTDASRAVNAAEECAVVAEACRDLNCNVPADGWGFPDADMKAIAGALGGLWGLVERLLESFGGVDTANLPVGDSGARRRAAAEETLVPLYQTIHRLSRTSSGRKNTLSECPAALGSIRRGLTDLTDPLASYWSLMVLSALLSCPVSTSAVPAIARGGDRDKEAEFANKSVILSAEGVVDGLVGLLFGRQAGKESGGRGGTAGCSDLIVAVIGTILESVLCSKHDTTGPKHFSAFISSLAMRHHALMSMLRTSSPLIVENTALLLHLLTSHSPETAQLVREHALSSGMILHHFHAAVFSPLEGQRFLSRYLCGLWFSGPTSCREKRLLRNMVPAGFLPYLDMPLLSQVEEDQLDELERGGIEGYESDGRGDIRGTVASEGAGSGGKVSSGGGGAAGTNTRRLRSRIGYAAAAIASERPGGGDGREQPENFRVLFHVLTKDHALPDLIWNQRTRRELRIALELELNSLCCAADARGGPDKIAWNHQQFSVPYHSLKDEVRVGTVYMRLWLQAGDGFIRTWDEPLRLFELLFRRLLCDLDRDVMVTNMCIRCLHRLYAVHWSKIGVFSDIMILVRSMGLTRNTETQHLLLSLISTLLGVSEDTDKYGVVNVPDNAEQLLNDESINQLCQFVAFGHTNCAQILTSFDSGTDSVRMLTDGINTRPEGSNQVPTNSAIPQQSMANDSTCPPIWFTAPPGKIPPFSKDIQGPYRVSDLMRLMNTGDLHLHSLASASQVETNANNNFGEDSGVTEVQIDTGEWRMVGHIWQLRWQLCSDNANGKGVYGPSDVALLAIRSLSRLVDLHGSTDSTGVPYFPLPIAKRLLCNFVHSPSALVGEGGSATGMKDLGMGFNTCDSLSIISHAMLCNDARVVESAAVLLNNVMIYNDEACAKLYLTGTFFFALAYMGSNFTAIAKLLHGTHLMQHFRSGYTTASDLSDLPVWELSVLGNLIPEGILLILVNYGYERFAEIFVGNYDTPEVIWSSDMRKHLVDMIRQHLGDFPKHLWQNTTAKYDYCPMPRLGYQRLEKEFFCHNYYLHNLVDEAQFPDWPIAEPVEVFFACLERWKHQMNHDVAKEEDAQEEARNVLGLNAGDSGPELRRAYRLLVRKYHPDKNPAGREMFERIQTSYEVLLPVVKGDGKITALGDGEAIGVADEDNSSDGLCGGQRQMQAVHVLMKAQILICKRYSSDIGKYKYPAYRMLLSCVKVPTVATKDQSEDYKILCSPLMKPTRVDFVRTAVELVFHTCLTSPLNVEELVTAGGMGILEALLEFYAGALLIQKAGDELKKIVSLSMVLDIITNLVHTIAGATYFESGRDALLSLDDPARLFLNWRRCLDGSFLHCARDNMENLGLQKKFALEGIASMARNADMQNILIGSGCVWPLIKCLLGYDPTLGQMPAEIRDQDDSSLSQAASNDHARLSARALGMLSGIMRDKLKTPPNPALYDAMSILLTKPIAKMLRNSRSIELLQTLNSNVETPSCVWNVHMREELAVFLDKIQLERGEAGFQTVHKELERVITTFQYSNLASEVVIGGIYVRIFNGLGGGQEGIQKIPDCSRFATSLMAFIARCLKKVQGILSGNYPPLENGTRVSESLGTDDILDRDTQWYSVSDERFIMGITSLLRLARVDGLVDDVICAHSNPAILLSLLELPQYCEAFDIGCDILALMSPKQIFADAVAKQGALRCLLHVLEQKGIVSPSLQISDLDTEGNVKGKGETSWQQETKQQERGWSILQSLVSSPSVATAIIKSSGWVELLGIIVGYPGFTQLWTVRNGAAKTLAQLLWDPNIGPLAAPLIHKFLPQALTYILKQEGSDFMLRIFDDESETPELIWNADMRSELRDAVRKQLDVCMESQKGGKIFMEDFKLPPNFFVHYKKLADELYIGGVYVGLFLKEPEFNLRDPSAFFEMLLLRWSRDLESLTKHGSNTDQTPKYSTTDAPDIVIDASVNLCKTRESLCDKLAEWGYMARSISFLHQAVLLGTIGAPLLSAVRLIHVAASRRANVEALALAVELDGTGGIVEGIMKAIGKSPLHVDSGFMVETLKIIFKNALGDVRNACDLQKLKMGKSFTATTGHDVVKGTSATGEHFDVSQTSVQCTIPLRGQRDHQPTRRGEALPGDPLFYAMAPSPAPGPEPVKARTGMVKSQGDDPLSFFLDENAAMLHQDVIQQRSNKGVRQVGLSESVLLQPPMIATTSLHQSRNVHLLSPLPMSASDQVQLMAQPSHMEQAQQPVSQPQQHPHSFQQSHFPQGLQTGSTLVQTQNTYGQHSYKQAKSYQQQSDLHQKQTVSYHQQSTPHQHQTTPNQQWNVLHNQNVTSYQPQSALYQANEPIRSTNETQWRKTSTSQSPSQQVSNAPFHAQQHQKTYLGYHQKPSPSDSFHMQYQTGGRLSPFQNREEQAQGFSQFPALSQASAWNTSQEHQQQFQQHITNQTGDVQQAQEELAVSEQSKHDQTQYNRKLAALLLQKESGISDEGNQKNGSKYMLHHQQTEAMQPQPTAFSKFNQDVFQEKESMQDGMEQPQPSQYQKQGQRTKHGSPQHQFKSEAQESQGQSSQSIEQQPPQQDSFVADVQNDTFLLGPTPTPQLIIASPMTASGIDARLSMDPTIEAEQKTLGVAGALGCAEGRSTLLQSAIQCNLPQFLVEDILENPTLSIVKDPTGTKVHSIELLKLLTTDPAFGLKFSLILDALPSWKKYKSQDHSLFVIGKEHKTD